MGDKVITEKNKDKYQVMDTDGNGVATKEEQKAYKQQAKQGKQAVKAVKKAINNGDIEYAQNIFDANPNLYGESAPEYLSKGRSQDWATQKALLEKKGGSNQTETGTGMEPLNGSVVGNSMASPAESTAPAQPAPPAQTQVSPNENSGGGLAPKNKKKGLTPKEDLKDAIVDAKDAANQTALESQEQYKDINGVDLKNHHIMKDNLGRELQEAIGSGKRYKNAIDSNEKIQGYRGSQEMINNALKGQKQIDKDLPKLQKSMTGELENKRAELEKNILGIPGSSMNDADINQQVQEYTNVIDQIKNAKVEEMGPLVDQFGSDTDKELFNGILNAWNSVDKMNVAGISMEDARNELLSLKQQINEEKARDENIVNAKNEHVKEINDFIYYLFDDFITYLGAYVSAANGDFGSAFNFIKNNALNQRNSAYSAQETEANTNLLKAQSANEQRNITGDNEVAYNMKMLIPELEKLDGFNQLNAMEQSRAIDALYEAFNNYKGYAKENPDFSVWVASKEMQQKGGWASIIGNLINTGVINKDTLNDLFLKFSNNMTTNSDAREKYDLLKVNGKADEWVNNAMNKASAPNKSASKPDPMKTMDMQNTVGNALQARTVQQQSMQADKQRMVNQKPAGQPQAPITPNKGWGTTTK